MDYQRSEKEFAAIYRRNERTIRRWKALGWPLDDEAATRLLIYGRGAPGAPSVVSVPRPEATGTLGLQSAVERLEQAEAAAHEAYLAACDNGDEQLIAARLKQWTHVAEQLRKIAVDTPEVLEANKNSVSVSELRQELTELFQQLRQDLEALPRRVAKELAGKDEIEIREGITREVNEVINNLYACRYLEGADSDR